MPAQAVAIVSHPDFVRYDFGSQHPMRPERIIAGLDLLRAAQLWQESSESLVCSPATEDELAIVHDRAYIRAVDIAGSGSLSYAQRSQYGLSAGDNPPFADMHDVASVLAGGALDAVRAIMDSRLAHVFHPAGGWHHAQRARASGFCIYNDPALAAAAAVQEYGARVLSIDLDCHHGDGIQWLFYDSPDVFTLSFHESGQFLFPGTGDVEEIGRGAGEGYTLNVPFAPFTRDDSWCAGLDAIVEEVAKWFRPDLIISNHGCDTHTWDPITHLNCTTAALQHQVRLIHSLAETYAGGRWLAVGSGGYDWRRVVPRSWAIVWADMSNRVLPASLPVAWRSQWLGSEQSDPLGFLDTPEISPPSARERELTAFNLDSVMTAIQQFRSHASG